MSWGLATTSDVDSLKMQPQFRKATKNMMLATCAIKNALGDFSIDQSLSLIIGSSYGELDTTKTFLTTLAVNGIARPFLFQNSLHNATSGFITLNFGIRGPALSVSNRYFTGENALEVASLLLNSGQGLFALVVAVDSLVEDLGAGNREIYPPEIQVTEGATALLLANDEGVRRLNKIPAALLEDIQYFSGPSEELCGEYYDSDALERLTREILSKNGGYSLKLPKPNGTHSIITWNRVSS